MENDTTEWDDSKNEKNVIKHCGLTFEEASEVFDDPFYLEKFDVNNSTMKEPRYRVIGRVKSQLVVFVVYTLRNGKHRIISARPALSRERKEYYDRLRNFQNN